MSEVDYRAVHTAESIFRPVVSPSQMRATVLRRSHYCYLLLMIFSINIPGFLAFDRTGLTAEYGLFNAQSISRITLTIVIGILSLVLAGQTRNFRVAMKPLTRSMRFVIVLFFLFVLTSVGWSVSSVALSLFRLFEWALLLTLLLFVFALNRPQHWGNLIAETLFRLSVIPIVIVLMGTLIIPDLAIESEDPDSGMRVFRLGGYLFHPTVLGVLAGVGFFYCIFFLKGKRRLLASAFFFAVLLLTYSRGALLGAIAAGTLCLLVDRRSRAPTVVGIIVVIFLLSVLVTHLNEEFITILSRGQDIENLTSLSGRVAVWSAGWQMFLDRPLLGYGFIAGPKEFLNDYTTVAYWAPPHAHNEFLQSALSGGVFAAILTSFIYLRALFRSLRLANGSNTNTFIMTVIVQLFIYAWAAPLLSYQVTVLSAVMMLVLLYIEIVGQPRKVTVRSRTNSKSAAS